MNPMLHNTESPIYLASSCLTSFSYSTLENNPAAEVMSFISNANMSQLGSLGEAIFQQFCANQNYALFSLHVGRADFLVNGNRVDVKTSRKNLNNILNEPRLRVRNTVPDTEYYTVEFNISGALISDTRTPLTSFNWIQLDVIYQSWKLGKFGASHTPKVSVTDKICKTLLMRIKDCFTSIGLNPPYILYRTIMFENESPDNLLPSQRSIKGRLGWTVFIVCHTAPANESTLQYIIAFPDEADRELPRLSKFGTSKHIKDLQKADLSRMPEKYKFRSLNELLSHFQRENGGRV